MRVKRYKAATEILQRAAGVVGRWGDQSAYEMVREIISDLAFSKLEGGSSWWLDLKFYPAVLLFYAFGLGALKAGQYGGLFQWLTQAVRREQRDSQAFIERFAYWSSETHDRWKMLPNLENRKTPLSDHLYDLTGAWIADVQS
jgi:hypothetical protein